MASRVRDAFRDEIPDVTFVEEINMQTYLRPAKKIQFHWFINSAWLIMG